MKKNCCIDETASRSDCTSSLSCFALGGSAALATAAALAVVSLRCATPCGRTALAEAAVAEAAVAVAPPMRPDGKVSGYDGGVGAHSWCGIGIGAFGGS